MHRFKDHQTPKIYALDWLFFSHAYKPDFFFDKPHQIVKKFTAYGLMLCRTTYTSYKLPQYRNDYYKIIMQLPSFKVPSSCH